MDTENARLRAALAEMQAAERKREVDAINAKIAAEEAARVAESKRLDDEAAQARAAEQERIRQRAWVNYNTDQALAGGNDSFAAYLSSDINAKVPAAGWPPGMEPDAYEVFVDENEAAPDSPLTAALARHGMKL